MKKQQKSLATKLVDILIIISMLFSIFVFIWILKGSLTYWSETVKGIVDINGLLFWIGLIVAIISASLEFVVRFIREIAKTIRRYN